MYKNICYILINLNLNAYRNKLNTYNKFNSNINIRIRAYYIKHIK